MADWDADSAQLQANLTRVLSSARQHALEGRAPSADLPRARHAEILEGLDVPDPAYVGTFRGEPPLEQIGVRVGHCWGAPPGAGADAVQEFIADLTGTLAKLDEGIPVGSVPESGDRLEAVLTTAALAHAKWIEIHPFANGNGRTARVWANWVLMRYGIPTFLRLRPRPEGAAYAAPGAVRRPPAIRGWPVLPMSPLGGYDSVLILRAA